MILDHVGDVDRFPFDADGFQELVEPLTRRADEGAAGLGLLSSRRFSHEEHLGIDPSLPEDELVAQGFTIVAKRQGCSLTYLFLNSGKPYDFGIRHADTPVFGSTVVWREATSTRESPKPVTGGFGACSR